MLNLDGYFQMTMIYLKSYIVWISMLNDKGYGSLPVAYEQNDKQMKHTILKHCYWKTIL